METNLFSPATVDIGCYRGEDVSFDFYVDPPNPSGGIGSWQPGFSISRYKQDKTGALIRIGNPLVDVACEISDPVVGTFSASLASSDFFNDDGSPTALVPGTYLWDTWRLVDGSRRVLQSGLFVVLPNARYG